MCGYIDLKALSALGCEPVKPTMPVGGWYVQSDPIGLLRDYSDPQLQAAIGAGALQQVEGNDSVLNHLYGYAEQNPLSNVDSNGLQGYSGTGRKDPVTSIKNWMAKNGSPCGPEGDPMGFFVPNQPGGNDFSQACKAHDECYSTCGADKHQCDVNFYQDMITSCTSSEDQVSCWENAGVYYLAVHTFGAGPYSSGQNSCQCGP